jgi:hypothetical protein
MAQLDPEALTMEVLGEVAPVSVEYRPPMRVVLRGVFKKPESSTPLGMVLLRWNEVVLRTSTLLPSVTAATGDTLTIEWDAH